LAVSYDDFGFVKFGFMHQNLLARYVLPNQYVS